MWENDATRGLVWESDDTRGLVWESVVITSSKCDIEECDNKKLSVEECDDMEFKATFFSKAKCSRNGDFFLKKWEKTIEIILVTFT